MEQANPQELWVPAESRANVEQTYFAEKFGFFFRINTGWLTPMDNDLSVDIFKHPYLDLLWILQDAIEQGTATTNNLDFTLDDFCYKPISGEGCIVTSPMQYFKSNQTALEEADNEQIKQIATCVPQPNQVGRTCFDAIGTPVLTFAVFGDSSCENEATECAACILDAGGMQMTFLLNNNEYSLETAEAWEAQVFIRNFHSFNYALGNDYHTDMTGPVEGMDYNQDLVDKVQNFIKQY